MEPASDQRVAGRARAHLGRLSAAAGHFSPGCRVVAPLAVAATVEEVEAGGLAGRLLLLRGDVAREQLMPKGFTSDNPERRQRVRSWRCNVVATRGPPSSCWR